MNTMEKMKGWEGGGRGRSEKRLIGKKISMTGITKNCQIWCRWKLMMVDADDDVGDVNLDDDDGSDDDDSGQRRKRATTTRIAMAVA